MMTQEDRARRAAELLTDPLFCELLEKLKTSAVKAWEASDNPLDREYCHARYRAVSSLTRDIMREVEIPAVAEVRAGQKGVFYNLFQKLKERF